MYSILTNLKMENLSLIKFILSQHRVAESTTMILILPKVGI